MARNYAEELMKSSKQNPQGVKKMASSDKKMSGLMKKASRIYTRLGAEAVKLENLIQDIEEVETTTMSRREISIYRRILKNMKKAERYLEKAESVLSEEYDI